MSDPQKGRATRSNKDALVASSGKKKGTKKGASRAASPITQPKTSATDQQDVLGEQEDELLQTLSDTDQTALRDGPTATDLGYQQQLKLAELEIQRLTLEKETLTLRLYYQQNAESNPKTVTFGEKAAATPKPTGEISVQKPVKVKLELEDLMRSGNKKTKSSTQFMTSPAEN